MVSLSNHERDMCRLCKGPEHDGELVSSRVDGRHMKMRTGRDRSRSVFSTSTPV